MAFYAEIYGFIAVRRGADFDRNKIAEVATSNPVFTNCFSAAVPGKTHDFISFACNAKLNANETELWIGPFENLLKQIEFITATVNVEHEAVDEILAYTYARTPKLQRIRQRLLPEFADECRLD